MVRRMSRDPVDRKDILDRLHESIVTVDQHGTVTGWNKGAERLFGYSAKEAIGLPVAVCHADSRESLSEKTSGPLREHGHFEFVDRLVRKSGEVFDGHLMLSALTDDRGNYVGSVCHTLDITERKRTEQVLRQYQRMVAASPDLMSFVDRDYRYLAVNEAYGKAYNRPLDQIVGHKIEEFIGKEKFDRAVRARIDACLAGASGRWRDWFKYEGLGRRYMDVTFEPVRDGDGAVVGLAASVRDITDLRHAEEELTEARDRLEDRVRERTRQLSTTLDTLIEGVITIDDRGLIQAFNPSAEKMFGYRADEVIGQNVDLLMPDEYGAAHDAHIRHYLETGKAKVIGTGREVAGKRKDGSVFPVQLSIGEMKLGDATWFVGTIQDITERKRAEAALRESEGMFRALTENTSDYTLVIGADGIFTYASPAVERSSGYTVEEVVGQKFESFALPDDLDVVRAAFDQALENPDETHYVPHFGTRGKDGRVVYYEALVTDMTGVEGVDGIVVNMRDTTERTLLEREAEISRSRMAELRRRLDDAVESFKDGFVLFDADDRVVLCNTAFHEDRRSVANYLKPGTPFEDLVRATYASEEIVRPEDRTEETIRKRIEVHKNPELGPWIVMTPKGQWIQINEYKTLDGGTALIRTNVSDRVNAEQEALRAKEQAEAANRAKSDFLSSMSHELRTPMNAILGFSQLLEADQHATLDDDQSEFVGEILRSGHHMLELINDILDLAKIESGDVAFDLRDQDPRPLIDACVKMIGGSAQQQSITVTSVIPEGDFPVVKVDVLRLKQALLNLLSNAVKYNHPGGEVRVECRTDRDGLLRIEVSDTGRGIPAEMLGKVFEPFDRLGAEESNIPGTGIGLTVTKKLIESMGGTVGVESTVGRGTKFWIKIPIPRAEENSPA